MTDPFAPTRMVAPVLRIRDLGTSVAWYRERLGLTPAYVSPDGAVDPIASFVIGGAPVVLWQLPTGVTRDRSHNETNSHVVIVIDRGLDDLHRDLTAAGVETTSIRPGSDNELFDFYDPDGNRFEVSRPAPELR